MCPSRLADDDSQGPVKIGGDERFDQCFGRKKMCLVPMFRSRGACRLGGGRAFSGGAGDRK